MRVLVACEFSGKVRDAFIEEGHDALSCDLLPSKRPGPHYQGDVRDILYKDWDLLVAHPPCTHIALSGIAWFKGKERLQEEALDFCMELWRAPIESIAIENPVSLLSRRLGRATQTIHPWQFGHPDEKKTCLWLRNLPRLEPTIISSGRRQMVNHVTAAGRGHVRSVTYQGIANAMAQQWGAAVENRLTNGKINYR